MKNIFKCSFLLYILLVSSMINAQSVGIGTVVPDPSSALDIYATDKGLLMPRMSSTERDLIVLPAKGLMIYNLTTNDGQINIGTPEIPNWAGLKGNGEPVAADTIITSITTTGDISTTSIIDTLMPGMTLSPPSGTYLIFFNGQYGLSASEPVSTAQGAIDLTSAYNTLMAIPATNTSHGPIFGNGEVLFQDVYDLTGAVSMADTLTMNGNGDSTSVFIIRMTGAFTTSDPTTVVLTNGARARNIFWVGQVAMAMAANTIMKGT